MRHRLLEIGDVFLVAQRKETSVVVETAEDVECSGHSAVDGSVVRRVLPETGHLYAFAHLKVIVLAVDDFVEITAVVCDRVVVECDILKSGVAPYRQTSFSTRNLDGAFVVGAVPFACDGGVAEKRGLSLCFSPFVKLQHIFASVVAGYVEARVLIVGHVGTACSHQHDDVFVPSTRLGELAVGAFPRLHRLCRGVAPLLVVVVIALRVGCAVDAHRLRT